MTLFNYKEWELVKEIKATNVLGGYDGLFYVTGALMYGATLAFYVLFMLWFEDQILPQLQEQASGEGGANEALPDRYMNILYTIIGLHSAVGLSVLYDAAYAGGKNILLQTFIIGAGTFNTISLAPIAFGALTYSDTGFFYAMASFASACISNAMMLALLFAIFHSAVRKTMMQGRVGATSQSAVGSLAF